MVRNIVGVCASTHHLGGQLERVDGGDRGVKGVTSPPQDNIQGWLHKPEFWTKNIFLMIPWKNEKIRFFEIFEHSFASFQKASKESEDKFYFVYLGFRSV